MLNIDGSQKSGSGTILRLSIALAGILQEPLHLYNIRQKRTKPGLRPQHLEAVLIAAKLCNAETEGVKLNSKELWFYPQEINGGEIQAEIGTAGSIPMLLLTILPICAHARNTVRIRIVKGGTDVRHSPTINYLRHVLLRVLDRMDVKTSLNIHKYGYYPKGMGEVSMEVQPCRKLKPLALEKSGELESLEGVSVCTFLEERKVAERQANAANRYLEDHGLKAKIRVVNDRSNPLQKGSSLVLWGETDTGALLGGDAIGELRKPSEAVGREAAENLCKEIETGATVDVHLADMLVPYVALVDDCSTYISRNITEHIATNLWLTEKILGVRFQIKRMNKLYQIEKKRL